MNNLHPAETRVREILATNDFSEEKFLPTRNHKPEDGHISLLDENDNLLVYSHRFNNGHVMWFCAQFPDDDLFESDCWPPFEIK